MLAIFRRKSVTTSRPVILRKALERTCWWSLIYQYKAKNVPEKNPTRRCLKIGISGGNYLKALIDLH
jgi:hypothetical protein